MKLIGLVTDFIARDAARLRECVLWNDPAGVVMEPKDVAAEIEKNKASITKLGKAQTGDKTKAAALSDLNGILKEVKDFQKTKDDLDKCIKEIVKLDTDIKDYNTGYDAMFSDAKKLAATFGKIAPDTKDKDYFKIANSLMKLGQAERPKK